MRRASMTAGAPPGAGVQRRRPPILLTALAILVVAELALRFGAGLGDPPIVERDPDIEYVLKPGETYRRFGARIQINDHHMRAAAFDARPASDEWRVMLVGDGVAFGDGLDDAQTPAARLTALLGARAPGCAPIVGTVAAPGWGPVNQLAYVDRFGLFGADNVVIVATAEDVGDYPTHTREALPFRLTPSYLALIDAAQIALARQFAPGPRPSPLSQREREARSMTALARLVAKSQIMGADAAILFHPTRSDLADGRSAAGDDALTAFARVAEAHTAPLIDLTQAYRAAAAKPENLYADERLMSARGAERLADAIAEHLARRRGPACAASTR